MGGYVRILPFGGESGGGGGAVDSVNGETGVVVLDKTDIGLGNVDNTSDDSKPVSTATQTALNLKAAITDIQLFTSSGTWTKPAGAKWVEIWALGAGGGGGSGRKGLATTIRCGGGGGSAGALMKRDVDAVFLGTSETVTVGAGGTGGASVTANSTNGNPGIIGGDSFFGTHLKGLGGNPGAGGTATTGAAGSTRLSAVSPWNFAMLGGAAASVTGGDGVSPSVSNLPTPNAGASGGGITAADSPSLGSPGGGITGIFVPNLSAAGGLAAAAAPAAGGNGNNTALFTGASIGSGGGSGRGSITGNAGAGGNGGIGGGGAGGGAALDATGNSGAGGNGGNGWVLVITHF